MLLNRTFAEILAAMKQTVGDALDTREGSFTDNVLRAAALELAQDYYDQNALIPIAFVDETSGEYIDKRAAEYGITRKAGTAASATVTFAGTDGTVIPASTAVVTASGLIFATDDAATIADGTATADVTAEAVGTACNVAADAIISLLSGGSVTVSGSTAATGGTDAETDASLLARLYAIWQTPATSGNANAYRQWALACPGIGGAKVLPLWAGNGTVKVILADSNMQPPTAEQVTAVAEYIDLMRPIGATVTVVAAASTAINVVAVITVDTTTTVSAAAVAFASDLADYLASLALVDTVVRYNKIAYLLLDTPGVTDFTTLTVNGGVANVTLSDNAIPVEGTVTVT